jgi:hypothetical protein
MERHEGVVPDRYQLEWCVEEAVLYRECRADLKATPGPGPVPAPPNPSPGPTVSTGTGKQQ